MDLKKIMSISGRSGLFRMVAQTKNGAIVESFIDGKRFPVFTHDKISSLEEITVFTQDEDMALKDVLKKIFEKENGGPAPDPKMENEQVWAYFGEVLPTFDKERVYLSDIRKMLSWYNLLHQHELLDFSEEQQAAEEDTDKPNEEEHDQDHS